MHGLLMGTLNIQSIYCFLVIVVVVIGFTLIVSFLYFLTTSINYHCSHHHMKNSSDSVAWTLPSIYTNAIHFKLLSL